MGAHASEPVAQQHGDGLVVAAASCWLGGLWSDALGEKKLAWSDTRTPGIEKRCHDVLEGNGIRVVDPQAVDAVARKVDDAAARALLRNVAMAARENSQARHAADRVKMDVGDDTTTPSERKTDKVSAGPVLRKADGVVALLRDNGPYANDAHAIGLLFALDRVEMARGLPMHLKVDLLGAPLQELFGVQAPSVPNDDSAPLPKGTWLTYVSQVATAAGHAIPQAAPREVGHREPLAWNGMLEGFADKLRALEPRIAEPSLGKVMGSVTSRLDDQYKTERSVNHV